MKWKGGRKRKTCAGTVAVRQGTSGGRADKRGRRRRRVRRGRKQFYGQHSLSVVVPTVLVPKAALPGWKRVVKGCTTTLYNALTRTRPSLGLPSLSLTLSLSLPVSLSLVARTSLRQVRYLLTATIKGTDALTRATITAKTNIFRESIGF